MRHSDDSYPMNFKNMLERTIYSAAAFICFISCSEMNRPSLTKLVKSALHERTIDTNKVDLSVSRDGTSLLVQFAVPDSVSHYGWCENFALHSMITLYSTMNVDSLELDSMIFEITNVWALDPSERGPWRYASTAVTNIIPPDNMSCDYLIYSHLFRNCWYSRHFFGIEELMSNSVSDYTYVPFDEYVDNICMRKPTFHHLELDMIIHRADSIGWEKASELFTWIKERAIFEVEEKDP